MREVRFERVLVDEKGEMQESRLQGVGVGSTRRSIRSCLAHAAQVLDRALDHEAIAENHGVPGSSLCRFDSDKEVLDFSWVRYTYGPELGDGVLLSEHNKLLPEAIYR